PNHLGSQLWNSFVDFATDGLKSVKLVRYWAQLLSYHAGSTVAGLTKQAIFHNRVAAAEPPVWMKESLREYEAHILMISDATRARHTSSPAVPGVLARRTLPEGVERAIRGVKSTAGGLE